MKDLRQIEAKAWLNKAKDDLRYAKANFKEGFYDLVCFLSQQIAEKALKSFLILKEFLPKDTESISCLG